MDYPGMQPDFNEHSTEISFEDFERIESLSRIQSDEDIENAVKDLLAHSHKIDAKNIIVEVDACNVTLSGTVHSEIERVYALSVVKLINGVGDVHSSLVIKLSDETEKH